MLSAVEDSKAALVRFATTFAKLQITERELTKVSEQLNEHSGNVQMAEIIEQIRVKSNL